jgi:hypothetical protein
MLSSSFIWNFPRKTRKKDAQSFHLIAREYINSLLVCDSDFFNGSKILNGIYPNVNIYKRQSFFQTKFINERYITHFNSSATLSKI